MLTTYFAAGLRNNERCVWVCAHPLPAAEALDELRAAWPAVDKAIADDALLVVDYSDWYTNAGGLKGVDVVQMWLREERKALADGYNGLRVSGNTSFLPQADFPAFMEYEQALNTTLRARRIVTLCSYDLHRCSRENMRDVTNRHDCAAPKRKLLAGG